MSNENSIKLNKYKLVRLFRNIRKLNGGKNILSRKLGITPMTLDDYLKKGQEYLDKFDEKLQPIYEIDIDLLDEEFEKHKNDTEIIEEFLAQDIGNTIISDKNKNAYEVFFLNKKENLKEKYIYDFQREIIDNMKFSEEEKEDEKIKLLILFRLIYDRAQMSLDEELLYLKNKYAKSSSRNISIVIKDLERRNKEDFGEEKEETKKITVNQQFNNFTAFSVEYDKIHGLLKKKDAYEENNDSEDIIDVEYSQRDD